MNKAERSRINKVKNANCVVCLHCHGVNTSPCDAHHATVCGSRVNHGATIALCKEHHQGLTGFHGLGRRAFERRYKLSEIDMLGLTNLELEK